MTREERWSEQSTLRLYYWEWLQPSRSVRGLLREHEAVVGDVSVAGLLQQILDAFRRWWGR